MPSLEEVIQHYEQQLEDEGDDVVADDVADTDEANTDESPVEPEVNVIATEDEGIVGLNMVDKVVDLGKPEEISVDMNKFSSIRAKELKEMCRTLGFSPKGSKQDLVLRLLKHPQFNHEDDIVTSIQTSKEEAKVKVEADVEADAEAEVKVEAEDSKEVIIS